MGQDDHLEQCAHEQCALAPSRSSGSVPGRVLTLQRFSVHDGPGIRTTVFLKGCPLRCIWCHNPESLSSERQLMVIESRCCGCGQCLEVCPEAGTAAVGGPCRTCGCCVEACPTAAREMAGRDMSAEEVLEYVLRDRVFYDQSRGGVTFSGGEPLAQPRFLLTCLDHCRSAGLEVALDTSGAAPRQVLLEAAARCDLVLFDVKTTDPEAHHVLIGAPLEPILANLRALDRLGTRLWLRLPLVAGLNDRPEDIDRLTSLLDELRSVERVCLLPYHATGLGKASRLAGPQPADHSRALGTSFEPPPQQRLDKLVRRLSRHGRQVGIGS